MVYHLARSQWIHYSEGGGDGSGRKGREVGGKVGEGGCRGEGEEREALEFELKPERLANLLGLILFPGHARSPQRRGLCLLHTLAALLIMRRKEI